MVSQDEDRWSQFAWIYSPSKLSQVSTDESLSYLPDSNIPLKTFYDLNEGIAWLSRQSSAPYLTLGKL